MNIVLHMHGRNWNVGFYVGPLKIVIGLLLIKMENMHTKTTVSVGCSTTVLKFHLILMVLTKIYDQ